MSDISRASVRVSTLIYPGPRAAMPTDQSISRRHARDFSHLPPVLLRSDRFPLPNYNKALPSIPSTSTGLEDSDAVSVFTSLSGSLTISPTPSRDAYERTSLTEAQRIAAQYRERHREAPNVFRNVAVSGSTVRDVNSNPLEFQYASLSSTVLESGARVDGRAVNATVATSSAPQSPPMRWAPAAEIETTHEAVSRFGRVHDDGTVSCAWEDCLGVLPSLAAFLSHLHVHLIHEGLNACELCGTWFTDDSHKEDHLNSCPKLPIFDEIGSSEDEPSSSLHNSLDRFVFK